MVELKRIYWSRRALRVAYSAVVVWLGASVVLALMPKAIPAAGSRSAATAAEVLRGMVDGVLAAVAIPGLFLVVLTVVAAVIRARDLKRRDPVRRFSRQQRREGLARAGGECEMEADFRRRCSRPAEHGDHFYPWSKGGSTSLQNFVAACSRCNRAKGARIPSPAQQQRLERRRRTYLTHEDAVAVGERQPFV
jgi:5-methylcytosine-specific restriction endonuclease McrA